MLGKAHQIGNQAGGSRESTMTDKSNNLLNKRAATGIPGFDTMSNGGLPVGRTTLVAGESGAGKTVFALQSLVCGARDHEEPGIFVAFEEHSDRILANAEAFGWDLPALQKKGLFFLNAQPNPDFAHSGDFDLEGMLSALEAKVAEMGARRIAFDAIDMVLALLENPADRRREIYRLNDWLMDQGLSAIITSKLGDALDKESPRLDFMQYMVDCYIRLYHHCDLSVSRRSIRIIKFRGTAYEENETPLVIGRSGMAIAHTRNDEDREQAVSTERISTGVERLDTMFDGGYHRGSSILITGAPGTAKTTLGGTFVQAACERGERALFVSFDSDSGELVRNLASVGIDLATPHESGLLKLLPARSIRANADHHLVAIRQAVEAHQATCLVVDPVSSLARRGAAAEAGSTVERLVDWAKASGITLVCTSLLNQNHPDAESTPLQISTIADTWIHLSYKIDAGERNRGLTIVKSRGTGHSRQVRELILDDDGVTLEDVYTAEGEVLMGTMRYERERQQALATELREADQQRQLLAMKNDAAELESRLAAIQRDMAFKQREIADSSARIKSQDEHIRLTKDTRLSRRGADDGEDQDADDK
jgi:circadian clock protein KaiC